MNLLVAYAFQFVGVPYKYGGNNPLTGMDCSAYVGSVLRAGGVLQHDYSAQGLFDYLSIHGLSGKVGTGSVVFFGQDTEHISHVGFCVNKDLMLEAGGGDHTVLTLEDAAKRDAFIKLSPITRRQDLVATIMPYYRLSLLGG